MNSLLRKTLTPSSLRVAAARPLAFNARFLSTDSSSFESIIVTNPQDGVALITLNRPKALNALNSQIFQELNSALNSFSSDAEVRAVVLTGSTRAFAAGADIKEMKDKKYADAYKENFLASWTNISAFRKPIIAAVSGFALGGGCELAMMCDIILASPTAVFGQPEINLGVIAGAGGTQRLTQAIGKSKSMELNLTGRPFSAIEAEKWGLVSKVVEDGEGKVVEEALKMAGVIASKGQLAVIAAKEAVNASYEVNLREGLNVERRLFHSLFASNDQKIGMKAFAEKDKNPKWTHT